MMDHTDETNKDVIEKLIAMEEEESLARFRASDFETKVRTKVRQLSGREGRHSLRRAVPTAAWVSLAAVMLAGAVILVILPKKTSGPDMAQMIADVLRQTPRIQTMKENARIETAPENKVASPMEQGFRSVLLAGIQSPGSDRSLNPNSPPASAKPKSRFLSLEETYKILVIDKAVERFLALIPS